MASIAAKACREGLGGSGWPVLICILRLKGGVTCVKMETLQQNFDTVLPSSA